MKKNQIESYQKCLLKKIYKTHKKSSRADLIKKAWRRVFFLVTLFRVGFY